MGYRTTRRQLKRRQAAIAAWPREAMVKAILDRHFERSLGLFPDAAANEAQARAEVETYRPYAEADVDAIIAVLDSA
jgi:hypothetical protein